MGPTSLLIMTDNWPATALSVAVERRNVIRPLAIAMARGCDGAIELGHHALGSGSLMLFVSPLERRVAVASSQPFSRTY